MLSAELNRSLWWVPEDQNVNENATVKTHSQGDFQMATRTVWEWTRGHWAWSLSAFCLCLETLWEVEFYRWWTS
jgi:hypothetical protein